MSSDDGDPLGRIAHKIDAAKRRFAGVPSPAPRVRRSSIVGLHTLRRSVTSPHARIAEVAGEVAARLAARLDALEPQFQGATTTTHSLLHDGCGSSAASDDDDDDEALPVGAADLAAELRAELAAGRSRLAAARLAAGRMRAELEELSGRQGGEEGALGRRRVSLGEQCVAAEERADEVARQVALLEMQLRDLAAMGV